MGLGPCFLILAAGLLHLQDVAQNLRASVIDGAGPRQTDAVGVSVGDARNGRFTWDVCCNSAVSVYRKLAGFALPSLVDGCHSELVAVALSEARHLQTGFHKGSVSVDLHPAAALLPC